MRLDLSVLQQPADFSARALLTIEALAPLSMVAKMPGKYYRSQPDPTDNMLYGLLENALGWHIADKERDQLLKKLAKKHKRAIQTSNVGYGSLLQWHLRFTVKQIPPLMHYDDLWAQHLRGASFPGGSRNYDYRAIPLMNSVRGQQVTIGDTADAKKAPALLNDFQTGDKVHLNVLRPYFPQYYASPTPREYVVPDGFYKYAVETTATLADLLSDALANPCAPLYLGSNDGWVDVQWEVKV
jgi:CRISPR-associated protein Cas5